MPSQLAPAIAIARTQLRYLNLEEGWAVLDDPIFQQGYRVREGDRVLGLKVAAVAPSAVELEAEDQSRQVLPRLGPNSAPAIQRPYPAWAHQLPVSYAPGVLPDLDREQQALERDKELRRQQPGEGKESRGGKRRGGRNRGEEPAP